VELSPLESAKAAFRARNLSEAERICLSIPKSAESLGLLGRIQALTERVDAAIATLQEALAMDPKRVDTLNVLASVYWQREDFLRAIETYERIVALQQGNAQVWSSLGLGNMLIGRYEAALGAFANALTGSDKPGAIHYQMGVALHKLSRYAEAAEEYKKALSFDSSSVDAWDNLGHALMSSGDASAPAVFQRGYEVAEPGPGRDLLRAKAICYSHGDLNEAEVCVESVIAREPSGSAYALLGNIQQQLGRFDDAAVTLGKAIELCPEESGPYSVLVTIKKLKESDRDLVERIAALTKDPSIGMASRVSLLFSLGKARNDLGEYQEAIETFTRAHRLNRELLGITFDREKHSAEIDRLISLYQPGFFENGASLGSQSEKPILIVGLPRSGTTLTDRVISAHPEVAAAGELRFWNDFVPDDAALAATPERLHALADEYLSILDRYGQGLPRVTDKAPWNYQHLGRILQVFPRAKIVHVQRHPVDNCLSLFMTPFDAPPNYVYLPEDLVYNYHAYQRLTAHWRKVIPSDRLIEIKYSDMVENTEETARKLMDFLGLEWDEACLRPEDNELEIRTASVWQARQPVYKSSLDRWRRYEPWLGAFRELLDPDQVG